MFTGNTPIRHGFRLQIFNDNVILLDQSKSGFEGINGSPAIVTFNTLKDNRYPQNNGIPLPNDYAIEFSEGIVDTSIEYRLFPPNNPSNYFPPVPVNFKVKNLTKDSYIDFFYRKTGTVTTSYSIYFRELVDTTVKNTWKVDLFYQGASTPLPTTGLLNLYTKKPFSGDDFVTFSTSGAVINRELASSELDLIKVVPNPYVVTHQAEQKIVKYTN